MSVDEALNVRGADVRKEYARAHPLLICVTLVAAIGGMSFLFWPSVLGASSIGAILSPGLQILWAVLYMAGGAGVIGAVWIKVTNPELSVRMEATGLCLLASCYVVYSMAIFSNRGLKPGYVAASVFAGLAVGMMVRAWTIITEKPAPWNSRSS